MTHAPQDPDLGLLLEAAYETRDMTMGGISRTELAQGNHVDVVSKEDSAVARFVVGGLDPELVVISRQGGENHPLVGAVHAASRKTLSSPDKFITLDGKPVLVHSDEANRRLTSVRFEQRGVKIEPADIPRFLGMLGYGASAEN